MTVDKQPPSVNKPSISLPVQQDLLALRKALLGLDALSLALVECLSPLPPSREAERAQALTLLSERESNRVLASLDALLVGLGIINAMPPTE